MTALTHVYMHNSSMDSFTYLPNYVSISNPGPLSIDAVSDKDVSAVHGKLWKSGLSIASLGDVSKVPKLSNLK